MALVRNESKRLSRRNHARSGGGPARCCRRERAVWSAYRRRRPAPPRCPRGTKHRRGAGGCLSRWPRTSAARALAGLYAWGARLGEAQRHVEGFEFLLSCSMSCVFSNRAIVSDSSCERTPLIAFCISNPLTSRSVASPRGDYGGRHRVRMQYGAYGSILTIKCGMQGSLRGGPQPGVDRRAVEIAQHEIAGSESGLVLARVIRQCHASARNEKLPPVARHHCRSPNRRPTWHSAAACSGFIAVGGCRVIRAALNCCRSDGSIGHHISRTSHSCRS